MSKMRPLSSQVKDRYRDLGRLRKALERGGSEFTQEMLGHLDIDFHPLNIDTGVTSRSVTTYFLPRPSFPSCRDMQDDLEDEFLGMHDDDFDENDPDANPNELLPSSFPILLQKSTEAYGALMISSIEHGIARSKITYHGWAMDKQFLTMNPSRSHPCYSRDNRYSIEASVERCFMSLNDDATDAGYYHYPDRDIEETRVPFLGDYVPFLQRPSHGMIDVCVKQCHEELPAIWELAPVIDEILNAMKTQLEELENMTTEQHLMTFHHILPRMARIYDNTAKCRVLYAYFDGSRLKVQFTKILDFGRFAVRPPPAQTCGDIIDVPQYHDMMDIWLKWTWPRVQGNTSKFYLRKKAGSDLNQS